NHPRPRLAGALAGPSRIGPARPLRKKSSAKPRRVFTLCDSPSRCPCPPIALPPPDYYSVRSFFVVALRIRNDHHIEQGSCRRQIAVRTKSRARWRLASASAHPIPHTPLTPLLRDHASSVYRQRNAHQTTPATVAPATFERVRAAVCFTEARNLRPSCPSPARPCTHTYSRRT
ncbi:hypothetical protein K458DRAFT_476042, partial [Lentithecium fluviatile CBS 122367]